MGQANYRREEDGELLFECHACGRDFSWKEDHYSLSIQRFTVGKVRARLRVFHLVGNFCRDCVSVELLTEVDESHSACTDCGAPLAKVPSYWVASFMLRSIEDEYKEWSNSFVFHIWCAGCGECEGGLFHGVKWCRRCGGINDGRPPEEIEAELDGQLKQVIKNW